MFKKQTLLFTLICIVSKPLDAMRYGHLKKREPLTKQCSDENGRSLARYYNSISPENTPELANRRTSSPSILDFMKQENSRSQQNSPIPLTTDADIAQALNANRAERTPSPEEALPLLPLPLLPPPLLLNTWQELYVSKPVSDAKTRNYTMLQDMLEQSKGSEKLQQVSLANKKVVIGYYNGAYEPLKTQKYIYAFKGTLAIGHQPQEPITDQMVLNGNLILGYNQKNNKHGLMKLETITRFEPGNNSTILYTKNGGAHIISE